MAIVTEYIQDKFQHFLKRWKTRFVENFMTDEEIVNDFMWTSGYYGEEMFNELLGILAQFKEKEVE